MPHADPAIVRQALDTVASLGDDRSFWLRKSEAEIRQMVEDGVEVEPVEVRNMLGLMRQDMAIGDVGARYVEAHSGIPTDVEPVEAALE